MKEQKNIVAEYKKIDFSIRMAALATVVRVRGSSYRTPGARMLITDDGKWVGSISGGCLEGDALRKARQVMTEKRPLTISYDTREESNQNLGISLGCNGIIDVLIEPIDPDGGKNPISIFEKLINTDKSVAIATIFSPPEFAGEKLVLESAGNTTSDFSHEKLNKIIKYDLEQVLINKSSKANQYRIDEVTFEVFIEIIQPTISIMIFGGGFDARPVSHLAKSIGWNVTVTDECVAHIAPIFFPDATRLSLCHREFIDREFKITDYTACILMSHNYEYDRDVLKKLINSPSPYIGILGPRKRFDKMLEEYHQQGISLTANDMHRIHSPIGLDIGAETPDEIALSIITEIQSKFANRSGGFLKYRNAPIHQRDQQTDQVFKEVYIGSDSKTKSANL